MMNKPFKGITVPFDGPKKIRYESGEYPELGDLVSKELCDPTGDASKGFRRILGAVVGINKQFNTPLVQWTEYEDMAVSTHPGCLKLVKRG
jgi:hypothetical protein